ncbi:DNA mismatch repair protein MutS [Methanolinea mesophila]|uniref:DNA mismatch repair protein MutS n=1 Tax=Methanolinea mesophila TaxID=547055 RepID=UPI001AE6B3E8|nr:DNA mismatch repair protein MutS [Methanolinea mesophila]MBP1929596.1 DNA mismatch repair protein MutS [Methanolinea mesophila]
MGKTGEESGPSPGGRLTPAMAQYQSIKAQYPGTILLFHIGDFYETFGRDAETISRELDITLTSRSRDGEGNRIPLAGVPCHAVDGYIARLLAKGYRVAVCDQVENSRDAKGLVNREVVRVITPGTAIDESMLSSPAAQYVMGVLPGEKSNVGLAFLDITTGEFFCIPASLDPAGHDLLTFVFRYHPRECVIPASEVRRLEPLLGNRVVLTPLEDSACERQAGEDLLREHFGVSDLSDLGIGEDRLLLGAAAMVLGYAKETQKAGLSHIRTLSVKNPGAHLIMDAITLRNLEILEGVRSGGVEGTLFSTMDQSVTPMGRRMLRDWIALPLADVDAINRRLDAVEYLARDSLLRAELRGLLKQCSDVERIGGRIAYGNAGPRDLRALAGTLALLPEIRATLRQSGEKEPSAVSEASRLLVECGDIVDLIGSAIVDDPPAVARNGGMIRSGFDATLDSYRQATVSGKEWIAALQQKERERTGIKSLKIGYNSVFGYYIEVTRSNLHLVPEEYTRKQTTSGGERYVLPELTEKEAQIAHAEERLLALEIALYQRLIETLKGRMEEFCSVARGSALLDVYAALAESSAKYGYCRPELDESQEILIREGRHPVVERSLRGHFVPNDARIDSRDEQILIITGANMAGKSTYMRSIALIVVMAQTGSFVPASYARIGMVDRIFTRVGAFDDLASGQSTFMVEMLELANILNNVTPRSLAVLDEIGRGTSTLDGYCIARAVLEFLHGKGSRGARTLFATHFHELVGVEEELSRVRNYHFAVRDTGSEVIFLRKIIPGATDRSYGIHVAALAGVPEKVTQRAEALMKEQVSGGGGGGPGVKRYTQMLLVDSPLPEPRTDPLIEELKIIDPDSLSPREALQRLYDLREALKKRGER